MLPLVMPGTTHSSRPTSLGAGGFTEGEASLVGVEQQRELCERHSHDLLGSGLRALRGAVGGELSGTMGQDPLTFAIVQGAVVKRRQDLPPQLHGVLHARRPLVPSGHAVRYADGC
jgi:hypothetical protein